MKINWTAIIPAFLALAIIPASAKANTGDFAGGVAIGTSYAGTATAPTNGLIVQGFVGLGTNNPVGYLNVIGGDAHPDSTLVFGVPPSSTYGPSFLFDATNSTGGHAWEMTATGYGNTGGAGTFRLYDDTAAATRLIIDSSGNVGIDTASPSYTLHVNGSVAGTSAYVNLSDVRYKKNIKPLSVGLNEIEQLTPVTFEWKSPKDAGMQDQQMGFIAQDVEKILPSVVVTANNDEATKGMKYSEITPVLVKAIQEQQAEIDDLKKTISALTRQTCPPSN